MLPDLDMALLTACVQIPSPLAAAQTFHQGLPARPQSPPTSGEEEQSRLD
ncbi:hypothetical protein [Halomicronema hongdechloris]|nr:hypothetical protein [Halomicronema hongdechloris]